MKNNKFINALLRRPFWILMAVLCIVFSSASKRLIELKMAPYFTASQALSKKLKDGSRDKREFLKSFIQSEKQNADSSIPELLFLCDALFAFAIIFFGCRNSGQKGFTGLSFVSISSPRLYLNQHRLQV